MAAPSWAAIQRVPRHVNRAILQPIWSLVAERTNSMFRFHEKKTFAQYAEMLTKLGAN